MNPDDFPAYRYHEYSDDGYGASAKHLDRRYPCDGCGRMGRIAHVNRENHQFCFACAEFILDEEEFRWQQDEAFRAAEEREEIARQQEEIKQKEISLQSTICPWCQQTKESGSTLCSACDKKTTDLL